MKKNVVFMLSISLISLLALSSCSKDSLNLNSREYLNNVSGTYKGFLVSTDNTYNGLSGTAEISVTPENQLMIHCYSELLDTTFVMDAFENGDSIMVCETGDEFYNEYGHMSDGYNMMGMHGDQSEWMQHLGQDHQQGDEHYGGFDMSTHTFNYKIKMMKDGSVEIVEFEGTKQY